jgi:hypothetical protein
MLLQSVRALWGAVLLLRPGAVLGLVGRPPRGVVRVARLLGARHLIEALILSRLRGRTPPRWPMLVDVAHGTSMAVTAAYSRRFRRDALASAAVAGLLASWGEIDRRQTRNRPR